MRFLKRYLDISNKFKAFRETGFSLTELLVSVAIITIISGAAIVSFRQGEKHWALKRAIQKVSQDTKRMQNMALSSPKIDTNQPKGYGIYFSTTSPATSYILFGDMDGSNSRNAGDIDIETVNIERGVKICTLETATNGTWTSVSSFSIVFVPPDPTTKFSGGDSITKNRITLCLITDITKTKQAIINIKGNVDIQ